MPVNIERLILTLYDSLRESPPWRSFLELMDIHIGCRSSAIQLRAPTLVDSGLVISKKVGQIGSPAMIDAFHDSPFFHVDDGKVQTLKRLMPEHEFKARHRKHYDYNREANTSDLISLQLSDATTGLACRFWFIRTGDLGVFTDKEIDAVKDLLPYLQSAVSLYARLVHHQKQLYISEETASQLGFGLIVVKSDGQILTMNSFAESILQQRKEFFVQQGRLHCADLEGEQILRRNLRVLEDHKEDGDCSFQVPCLDILESTWMVTMLRYSEIPEEFRGDNADTYSVIVQRRTPISAEQISRLFELTPAEAQLAKQLVQGESLSEAAEKLGRSRSTARVQLAAIFAKTGVHKQHQLISHILHSASRLSL